MKSSLSVIVLRMSTACSRAPSVEHAPTNPYRATTANLAYEPATIA